MLEPENIRHYLLTGSAIFLSITIFACLLRAILGPRFTDRVIAANIIGTKTIALISIMSLIVGEDYLVDICLIYAIISFMSVVILARSVIEQRNKKRGKNIGGGTFAENIKIDDENKNNKNGAIEALKSQIRQIWLYSFPYYYDNYIFQEDL